MELFLILKLVVLTCTNLFIVAVLRDSTSVKPQYLRKRFSTFNNSPFEFRNWLLANDCQNVCMESTGKYHVPVYNALEGHISNARRC